MLFTVFLLAFTHEPEAEKADPSPEAKLSSGIDIAAPTGSPVMAQSTLGRKENIHNKVLWKLIFSILNPYRFGKS